MRSAISRIWVAVGPHLSVFVASLTAASVGVIPRTVSALFGKMFRCGDVAFVRAHTLFSKIPWLLFKKKKISLTFLFFYFFVFFWNFRCVWNCPLIQMIQSSWDASLRWYWRSFLSPLIRRRSDAKSLLKAYVHTSPEKPHAVHIVLRRVL